MASSLFSVKKATSGDSLGHVHIPRARSNNGRSRRSTTRLGAGCEVLEHRLCLAPLVDGGTFVVDDFNDGDDDGWLQVDISQGQPGGPAVYDASSGAYHIQTKGVIPADSFAASLSFWGNSFDPVFSDGVLRATVRAENAGTAIDLLMRFDPSVLGGYTFGMESPGSGFDDFFFVVIKDNQIVRNETFNVSGFPVNAGEDWIIEAGVVCDQVTMKAWPASEPEPEDPQLILTDSTFSTGLLGLGVLKDPSVLAEPWQLDGTFDDVHFSPVPALPPGVLVNPGLGGNLPPGLQAGLPSAWNHSVSTPAILQFGNDVSAQTNEFAGETGRPGGSPADIADIGQAGLDHPAPETWPGNVDSHFRVHGEGDGEIDEVDRDPLDQSWGDPFQNGDQELF